MVVGRPVLSSIQFGRPNIPNTQAHCLRNVKRSDESNVEVNELLPVLFTRVASHRPAKCETMLPTRSWWYI
jgi:hypothetical protein